MLTAAARFWQRNLQQGNKAGQTSKETKQDEQAEDDAGMIDNETAAMSTAELW